MTKLEKSERELLESVESGEWRTVPGKDSELDRYREYARATFRKDTVGIGVAGTLGVASAAAVTVLGSAVVLPAIVGIGVTIATKKMWDRIVSRDPKLSKQ